VRREGVNEKMLRGFFANTTALSDFLFFL